MTGLLLLLSSSSTTALAALVGAAIAGQTELPALAQVQEAAVAALELTPSDEVQSWSSRARWRGAVPRLDGRFGTDLDQSIRDDLDRQTTRAAQALGVQVSARFELGRLLFDDFELRASRERIARAARIALARDRVTKIYFERLRVWLQSRTQTTPELILRAAELDGMLRAATGGRIKRGPQP